MCNTTTPLRSGGLTAGRPTVRKVQFRSGRRMAQEANADGRKAAGNREPLFWRLRQRPPDNWSDTGGCPARKGADVGQVSLWRPGDRETPEPMGKLDTVTVNGPEGAGVDWDAVDWR